MTTYIVLCEQKHENVANAYYFMGAVEAASAEAAIRQLEKVESGRYVAVPTRSFQIVDVKVETQTKIKVG